MLNGWKLIFPLLAHGWLGNKLYTTKSYNVAKKNEYKDATMMFSKYPLQCSENTPILKTL